MDTLDTTKAPIAELLSLLADYIRADKDAAQGLAKLCDDLAAQLTRERAARDA